MQRILEEVANKLIDKLEVEGEGECLEECNKATKKLREGYNVTLLFEKNKSPVLEIAELHADKVVNYVVIDALKLYTYLENNKYKFLKDEKGNLYVR